MNNEIDAVSEAHFASIFSDSKSEKELINKSENYLRGL
jgi:hypothetical protein